MPRKKSGALPDAKRIIESIPSVPFSVNELSEKLSIHPLQIRRVLNVLHTMRLISRVSRAYQYKVWYINKTNWPTDPVDTYNWWRIGYPKAYFLARTGRVREARLTYE